MRIFFLFVCAVCTLTAAATLIFCLVRSSGPERKKLLRTALLLGAVALLRFGGEAVLSWMDMGWRCTPRYVLDFMFGALLLITVYRCKRALGPLESRFSSHPTVYWSSQLALAVAMFLIPVSMVVFSMDNLSEEVVVRDGQEMVREFKINGGAVSRCYAPVNGLVHGVELDYDWYGVQPPPAAAEN